jgi:hypothetical protein
MERGVAADDLGSAMAMELNHPQDNTTTASQRAH